MLDEQVSALSTKGARGRRKSGLRFSSSKTIRRSRLLRAARQNECMGLGDFSKQADGEELLKINEEGIERAKRPMRMDMSNMLETAKELAFESSAIEKGSCTTHSISEEVYFQTERWLYFSFPLCFVVINILGESKA